MALTGARELYGTAEGAHPRFPPPPAMALVCHPLGCFGPDLPGSSQEVERNARNLLFHNRLYWRRGESKHHTRVAESR